MNEDGKVHPLYLRGGLLDESMLEALKARGLDVDLPQTINKWNSLLPRDPPETNDRTLLRQYYQRLREADVALLGEIENKVGRTEDARETIWKVFGDAVRQRLMVANLHSYRTPQELMMDFASELSKWIRTKGAAFEETLQQQWTIVFKHLVEDVFAQDSDVRDALKESEQTITGWRALVSFFQQSANELEAVMSKMRMWERLLGLEAGLGKRAASDQDKSRDPAGSSDSRNTRRRVLQPSTTKAESTIANGKTDCVPGKAGVKVPCSFLMQFGDCKHNKCPFAHDESALPEDQRQQLVLAGKRVLEKEKKKDHEFKMGGCTWCWMPKSNKDFRPAMVMRRSTPGRTARTRASTRGRKRSAASSAPCAWYRPRGSLPLGLTQRSRPHWCPEATAGNSWLWVGVRNNYSPALCFFCICLLSAPTNRSQLNALHALVRVRSGLLLGRSLGP
jgi:hypothetical protein